MGKYRNLSISFSKENSIYLEMLQALSAYLESRGIPREESAISNIIIGLIKEPVKEKLANILEKDGIDVLAEYREFERRHFSAADFFERNRSKKSAIGRMIEEKLEGE